MDFRLPNNKQANYDTEPLPAYIKNLPKKQDVVRQSLAAAKWRKVVRREKHPHTPETVQTQKRLLAY
jgi:hypothetical protein